VTQTGTLYVVATPIGNLQDVTLRAIDTLRTVLHVAAEDTRRTRALLAHLGIQGRQLHSLHAHSTEPEVERLALLLQRGEDIALATDAGTPLVSDPGSALVRAAIRGGARVVPIPGPSSVLAALVVSGMATDGAFRFVGFVPRAGPERRDAILRISATPEPVVLFEAANRTTQTLRDLADRFDAVVAEAASAASLTGYDHIVSETLGDGILTELDILGEILAETAREAALERNAPAARIVPLLSGARGEYASRPPAPSKSRGTAPGVANAKAGKV